MNLLRCSFRFVALRAMVMALLCIAVATGAPVRFHLPSQSAASALVAFAKQADVEVLFGPDELKGVNSNPVSGTYEPYVAIELLLRGTGFAAVPNSTRKFVVVRQPSKPPGQAVR